MSKDALGKLFWNGRDACSPLCPQEIRRSQDVWEENEAVSKPRGTLQGLIVTEQLLSSSSRLSLMMPGTVVEGGMFIFSFWATEP